MKRQKTYDDDDGRTIADMSGVQRDNLFLPRRLKQRDVSSQEETEDPQQAPFTNDQRRTAVGGALTAALLIAGIFIGAGAIVIALLTQIWH